MNADLKFGKDTTLGTVKITAEFQAELDAMKLASTALVDNNTPAFTTTKGVITTNAAKDFTAITGIPEDGIALLMVVGTGTVTYQNVTTAVIKKDPIKVGNYSLARIENIGTLASPSLIISDAIAGGNQLVIPDDGTFSHTEAITLDRDGKYTSLTVTTSVAPTFTGTHKEGVQKKVALVFDGTDSFTAPTGCDFTYVSNAGNTFTNGGNPASGTYDCYFDYDNGLVRVTLKERNII